MTACASNSGSTSSTGVAKKAPAALIVAQGGLGDKSYNDLGYSGFTEAVKKYHLTGKPVESSDPVGQAKTMLTSAGRAGYGAVIDLEYSHSTTLPTVAKAYPKTSWALINATAPGKNVASVLFQEQEGSYLAGALAALQTQNKSDPKVNTQNVIGVIGGAQSAGIDKFIVGYIQGARAVDPSIKVLTSYSNDFANPTLGAQLAKSMYSQGADVVYGVAGGTGIGIIKEAKAENHYAIGVDADQDALAPGHVLTTMIKRTDVAVETLVKDYDNGAWPGGKTINLGLAQNGVGLSEFKYTKSAIGTSVIAKLNTMRANIISGKTKVWNVVAQGYPSWYKK